MVAGEFEVDGDVSKDTAESSDPKWVVARNSNVVFGGLHRGEAHVAAGLAGDVVAEWSEESDQIVTGDVAGDAHLLKQLVFHRERYGGE